MSLCVCIALRRPQIRSPGAGVKTAKATSTTRADRRPARAPGVIARERAPAEHARAAEDREQRGGQQQVAAEDRQAGRREHAERADADEAGRDRQRRLRRMKASDERGRRRPRRTGRARAGSRRAGAARCRHVVEAGDALEVLRAPSRCRRANAAGRRRGSGRAAIQITGAAAALAGSGGASRFTGDVDDREAATPRVGGGPARPSRTSTGAAPSAAPRRGSRRARARRTGCRSTRARRSSAPGRG